jgi:hypothetical protein
MCILLDAQSFGGDNGIADTRARLQIGKIPSLVVRYGDELTGALSQRAF